MKNHFASFRLAAGAFALGATAAHAQFTLLETGGTFRTDATNHAVGATPFAYDSYGNGSEYGGVHLISHLNDGLRGNSQSWIGGQLEGQPLISDLVVAVGVIFNAPVEVASFAYGRDNTGTFADRAHDDFRFYTFQYSTDPTTGFEPLIATWITIGTINFFNNPSPSPALRNLYSLSSITGVTAFRILTQTEGSYASVFDENDIPIEYEYVAGSAIDELEVYGPATAIPEPAAVAGLAGLAALGLAATRRRRV